MTYTTNRLNEALGDLMSRDPSSTDNLKAARNHLGAASALLDALRTQSTAKSQGASPMTTQDLNQIAETATH